MMKKILVTGCNGQLGRAIRQEYKGEDVSFINTDVAEGEGIVAPRYYRCECCPLRWFVRRDRMSLSTVQRTPMWMRANSSGMPHTGSMRSDREI